MFARGSSAVVDRSGCFPASGDDATCFAATSGSHNAVQRVLTNYWYHKFAVGQLRHVYFLATVVVSRDRQAHFLASGQGSVLPIVSILSVATVSATTL